MLIWVRLLAGRPMAGHMVLVHGIGVRILSGQPLSSSSCSGTDLLGFIQFKNNLLDAVGHLAGIVEAKRLAVEEADGLSD